MGAGRIQSNELTPAGFSSYVAALLMLIDPISHLTTNFNEFQQGQASLRRLRAIEAEPIEPPDRADAQALGAVKGELVLDQVVTEGDKPLRQRQWRLTEVAPGRYEGTLSEAIGPVEARAEGNRLVITFTIKGGFAVRQELTLAPDGRSAANVLKVKKLGMTLAVLSEDIRKTP